MHSPLGGEYLTSSAFLNTCREHELTLCAPLSEVVMQAPDAPVRRLIAPAGAELRQPTPKEMATALLPESIIPKANPSDWTSVSVLRGIINASIEPAVNANVITFGHESQSRETALTCDVTEPHFARTIARLQDSDPTQPVPLLGATLYTHNGNVFAVGKQAGLSVSLLLDDIILNGAPYPAGSLMHIETTERHNGTVRLHDTTNGLRMSFVRLSAFAYPIVCRNIRMDQYNRREPFGNAGARILETATIDDMRIIAHGAMLRLKAQEQSYIS